MQSGVPNQDKFNQSAAVTGRRPWLPCSVAGALGLCFTAFTGAASENVPYRPFGLRAEVLDAGTLFCGLTYQESEAYHIHAGNDQFATKYEKGGESYGIDINQGFLSLEYGINSSWTADASVGYTTMGSRYFSNGEVQSTTGLMDLSFGLRYQLTREATNSWIPSMAFRAGAVLPGSFEKDIPFAPGQRAAAIEPEFILRKHFGWTGFGAYGDILYRWNRTTRNDLYIASTGVFQQIGRWELDLGYRRLQTISGANIQFDPANPSDIFYPRAVREVSDSIEAGFSYTTKKALTFGFQTRTIVDGANTDQKFWVGGSISYAFSTKR